MNDVAEPKRERISARIACLERRQERLSEKIERREGSDRALSFDREELAALDYALKALRLYREDVDGIDGPVTVLEALVDAIERDCVPTPGSGTDAALRRAHAVLEEWQ